MSITDNNKHIVFINENNEFLQNAISGGNRIIITQLKEYFAKNAFSNFSLKFSPEGGIGFKIQEKEINLSKNEMLLAARRPGVLSYIDSENVVTYISIDISPDTLDEAFNFLKKENKELPVEFKSFFTSPLFFDHICNIQEVAYSQIINQLVKALYSEKSCFSFIDDKWFLKLAREIIKEEYFIYFALNNLHSLKKLSTRKEILLRLLNGKKYIDTNYLANPEISKVASYCNLSVFYFFRSFKQAFQLTPYQYLLQKRLDHALSLMVLNRYSLTEIAFSCGFPDIFTFSKAFKRQFRYPPSKHILIKAA